MRPIIHLSWILFLLHWSTGLLADSVDGSTSEAVNCTRTLVNFNGEFKVVNKDFVKCSGTYVWEIKNKTRPINLFIHTLFLDKGDVVTLHRTMDDADNDADPLIDPLRVQAGSVTVLTEELDLYIKLKGDANVPYMRKFDVYYDAQSASPTFPIGPEQTLIEFPIHTNISNETNIVCHYTYALDQHKSLLPSFTFEEFNLTSSKVELEQSTKDGQYMPGTEEDFFPSGSPMTIKVTVAIQATGEHFRLKIHPANKDCSGKITVTEGQTKTLASPLYQLNNGTITEECRWVINTDKHILGVALDRLELADVLDIVSINDGASEISPPLLQVTTSNKNSSKARFIRSSGSTLWIGFKPVTFMSNFTVNITVHGQGGYFRDSAVVIMDQTTGNDSVFLMEVEKPHVLLLQFKESEFPPPATLRIYDDFEGTHLLTTLHGNVAYPVISTTSRMMMVATSFSQGSFRAAFKRNTIGCIHMSTYANDNYVLSGNCNSTCVWVIPPQEAPKDVLYLNLQYVMLEPNDEIKIQRLDSKLTQLAVVSPGMSFVPHITAKATEGLQVQVVRGACKREEDLVLVGHISYVPECGGSISLTPTQSIEITSPSYPNTYPLYSICTWNLEPPKDSGSIIHLAFLKMKLAPEHCIRVTESTSKKTSVLKGDEPPQDLLFSAEAATLEFDSSNCNGSAVTHELVSDEGFVVNATVADCGQLLLNQKSGEFSTSVVANKTFCVWKLNVPAMEADESVNIIIYTVHVTEDKGNYELHVYDGASTRDPEIKNISSSEIWSRTNNLLITFRRVDTSKPASVLVFKYSTKSCDKTMQCHNKVCLHPDWLCNGINDCGDDTDERRCLEMPVPPETKVDGYSGATLGVTIVFMLLSGVLLGIGVPICYQKYKNGQYHRFGDISVIE